VLDDHFVGEAGQLKFYRMALPRAKDISIRYQIGLSKILADEVFQQGILRTTDRLAVIGAGVSGSSFAMEAANRGVEAHLFGAPNAFSVQRNCHTRFLHPNQYSWPKSGWTSPSEATLPLRWEQGYSHQVAEDWTRQLNEFARNNYRLILRGDQARLLSREIQHFEDFLKLYEGLEELELQMVLLATGWKEACTIGRVPHLFTGWRFWETDKVADGLIERPRILVSGAGDGALQDVLRLCFKPIPGDLMQMMDQRLEASSLMSATEFFRTTAETEFELFKNYFDLDLKEQEACCRRAEELWEDAVASFLSVSRSTVAAFVQEQARFDFRNGSLLIICKNRFLGKCYSLNRVLVFLLLNLAKSNGWAFELLKEAEATTQDGPDGHTCSKADECWGLPHQVEFANCPTQEFDYIIVRHGVQVTHLSSVPVPR